MNHEKYEERLALVKQVFQGFNLEPTDISPVDYEENLPFPYNNFIYKVSLAKPAAKDAFLNPGPYTAELPREGPSELIIRLSNPAAEGLSHSNRVENEVAAIHLAREGLAGFKPDTVFAVPAVYAWQPAQPSSTDSEGRLGWIIMEFKPGVSLDKAFQHLDRSQKNDVLGQLADIFSGIQRAPLPKSLDSYGGITIQDGKLVHGQMTTLSGGPWKTYGEFWSTRLASQLEHSEGSSALQGWKPNGVRERIDKLFAAGVDSVLKGASVDTSLRSLVHADLTMNNVLFDAATNKVTGLVDFDFSCISHPFQEFVTSFGDVGGNISGGHGPDLTEGRLSKALLTGSFDADNLPAEASELWASAKAWDAALGERGTLKPSTITGISALAQLGTLEKLLCPFRLAHPMFLKKLTQDQIAEQRQAAEEALKACLGSLGF
ncbi:phosphotransferase enzyme family protein [Colletotrichum truncatum]|uniref:Phosphotransferase enzyme family protein n=1 Tax=Colletotrichum truncatum TaxID=5467 RepID=A0ACC3YFC8_COLTU|nr:phosphotransferase enzyme family protein [Colletotrichum truncatum]KAF6788306.1 phosphotransferase enzyme family protein [Colletotrichum truncatum]